MKDVWTLLRLIGQKFERSVDISIGASTIFLPIGIGVAGLFLLVCAFLLLFAVVYLGLDVFVELFHVGTASRRTTAQRYASFTAPLRTLILLLPGAAVTYLGFVLHRRNIRTVGFVTGFLVTGILGAVFGVDGTVVLVVAVLGGLVGAKLALATEVAIALLLGFLFGALLGAVLLGRGLDDPLVLLIGIVGAIQAWRFRVLAIVVGTAATGAIWMTVVSSWAQGDLLLRVALAPGSVGILFLYLFLSGAAIQTSIVNDVFRPLDYVRGGSNRHEAGSSIDRNVGVGTFTETRGPAREDDKLRTGFGVFYPQLLVVGSIVVSLVVFPAMTVLAAILLGLAAGAWRLYGYYDDGRRERVGAPTPSPHLELQDELLRRIGDFVRVEVEDDFELSDGQIGKSWAATTVVLLSWTTSVLVLFLATLVVTGGLVLTVDWIVANDG